MNMELTTPDLLLTKLFRLLDDVVSFVEDKLDRIGNRNNIDRTYYVTT